MDNPILIGGICFLAALLQLPGGENPRAVLENDIMGFFSLLTLLSGMMKKH